MKEIPDGSIDMVLTDPPYGTTACKWDAVIPLSPMWEQLKRVTKSNGAIVMTASQPFTSILVSSYLKGFKYCWVWEKNRGSNFATTKYMPMKEHGDIVVFSNGGGKAPYYPIMQERAEGGKSRSKYDINASNTGKREVMSKMIGIDSGKISELRVPRSIQKFNTEVGLHPTQKPVALMEYLIKTYTKEGETVLDFTMGSGTTGVACVNTNRNFIGIENDEAYFKIAQERIGVI
jgi:site-specific DNA-methyltransferase (adenine-specific)